MSHWRAGSGESIRRVIVKEQESEASDRQGLPSHILTLSQCQVSASAAPGKVVLGLENVVGVGRDAVCV